MSAPAPVLIARAIEAALQTALTGYVVTLEREREAALRPEALPAVLVRALDTQVEASFIGGAELRVLRVQVEAICAARTGDDPADLADRTQVLLELARDALLADRTLGGESLGIWVEEGGEPRGQVEGARAEVMARSLIATCAYA